MTCNEDASVLWVGEGGSIAFVDSTSDAGMSAEVKRVPVGSPGVWPCDVALDPEALITDVTSAPGEGGHPWLYIAGGRHGLWAMEADPRASVVNRAILLDDSGKDQGALVQGSRRWCNAVDFVQVGEETYLVALFAKRAGTRVRIYPLDRVRAAMASLGPGHDEFGHTLDLNDDDVLSIRLPRNPAVPFQNPVPPVEAGLYPVEVDFAYGFGLGVDDSDPEAPCIYVALGMHGLVRIRLEPENFQGPGATDPVIEPGPWFGDDTVYFQAHPAYGHMVMHDDGDPDPAHRERPLFMDVSVDAQSSPSRVYVALDHLGWMVLDPAQWSTTMPIEHHEGLPMVYNDAGWSAPDLHGASLTGTDTTYAVRIEASTVSNAAGVLDPVVLVCARSEPARTWNGTVNEGRSLDHTGTDLGKIPRRVYPGYSNASSGEYTIVYRDFNGLSWQNGGLQNATASTAHKVFEEGGFYAHAPDVQPVSGGFTLFLSEMVVPETSGGVPNEGKWSVSRKTIGWGPSAAVLPGQDFSRLNGDRPGLFCYEGGMLLPRAGEPFAAENVVLVSGNDGEMVPTGTLFVDGQGDLVEMAPAATSGADRFGIVFSPTSQWVAPGPGPGDPQERWVLGTGRPASQTLSPEATFFRLVRVEIGGTSTDPTWTVVEDYHFRAPVLPEERFGREAYFGRGHVDPAFDAYTGGDWVMITLSSSYQGLYIVDRSDLVFWCRSFPNGINEDEFFLSTNWPGVSMFVPPVHAEMDEFHDTPPDPSIPADQALLKRLAKDLRIGAMGAAPPRTFRLPGTGGRRILAVPAWTAVADPDNPDLADPQETWLPPQVWLDNHSRMFVRLYEIVGGGLQPMPTIFGPDDASTTIRLEPFEVTNPDTAEKRAYLAIADFTGRLTIQDVTDLQTWTASLPDPEDEVWDQQVASYRLAEGTITDERDPNLYGLEVDVVENRPVLYLSAWRHGVEILEFDPFERIDAAGTFGSPGSGEADRFHGWGLLQTSYNASSAWIQEAGPAQPARLIVPDGGLGLRIYTR